MEQTLGERARRAWNVFRKGEDAFVNSWYHGSGSSSRPDLNRLRPGNEKSIVASICTRIAMDVAAQLIQHVQLDEDGKFLGVIRSGLNECLNVSANIDQSGKDFIQDIASTMLDEGVVAIVPVDAIVNPMDSEAYNIRTLRAGKIVQWYPRSVRVSLYNDRTGLREEVTVPKEKTAIVTNPLYAIMNEPNSTLKRLTHKLNLLDISDEKLSSGKLDIIIQLPYVIKSEMRKKQAENRRKELEDQLSGSQYGIAYTDGTEKITQLNRAAENNLLAQVEYLQGVLYNQLGMSEAVFDGTADETAMTNYYSRTIDPIITTIALEMDRKFLNAKARAEYQAIRNFRDPFDLVPISKIPEMADRLTRNEIMSSNEIRQVIGLKASKDPRADELLNKNMSAKKVEDEVTKPSGETVEDSTPSTE